MRSSKRSRDRGSLEAILANVVRGGRESFRKKKSLKAVLTDVVRGAPHKKSREDVPKHRETRPTKEVAKGGPDKMSEEKSLGEVVRGCSQGRSREEVVSGGPQKRL